MLGSTQIPTQLTEKLAQYSIKLHRLRYDRNPTATVCAKLSDGKRGVGQPLAGREVRLVCDEIWVRGAGLALGYWQQGKICSLLNGQGLVC